MDIPNEDGFRPLFERAILEFNYSFHQDDKFCKVKGQLLGELKEKLGLTEFINGIFTSLAFKILLVIMRFLMH